MSQRFTATVSFPRNVLSSIVKNGDFQSVKGSVTKEMAKLEGQTITFIATDGFYDFYDTARFLGCGWKKAWLKNIKPVEGLLTVEDIQPGNRFIYNGCENTRGVLIQINDKFALGGLNGVDFQCFNIGGPGFSRWLLSREQMVDYLNGKSGYQKWQKAE